MRTTDCRLHIRSFQIIAEMGVNIFMVIPQRKLSILPVKAMSARIVLSGGAYTVSSPIPKRTDNFVQQRIIRIYRPTFPCGHVMRRIKAGSSNIPNSSREIPFSIQKVTGTESVTVIFDQPQMMLITEILYCFQLKRITKRMRNHNRSGFF